MAIRGLNIRLGNEYRITSDELNYTLERIGVNTALKVDGSKGDYYGNETFSLIGHHRTLADMFKRAYEDKIRVSNAESILELSRDIEKAKTDLYKYANDNINIRVVDKQEQFMKVIEMLYEFAVMEEKQRVKVNNMIDKLKKGDVEE